MGGARGRAYAIDGGIWKRCALVVDGDDVVVGSVVVRGVMRVVASWSDNRGGGAAKVGRRWWGGGEEMVNVVEWQWGEEMMTMVDVVVGRQRRWPDCEAAPEMEEGEIWGLGFVKNEYNPNTKSIYTHKVSKNVASLI
ncbi:hypothetical protein Tco_0921675 [Tanacetum coccineum]